MKKLTLAAGLLLSLGLTSSAFASDGTITITGKISDQTCVIETGQANQTVLLPTIQANALNATSKTAGLTSFSISIKNCGKVASNVKAYFLPDTKNVNSTSGNLVNISTESQKASNVEIQLLDANKTAIKVGKNVSEQSGKILPLNSNGKIEATLVYYAQYFATAVATPGDVKAQVEYNIVYN